MAPVTKTCLVVDDEPDLLPALVHELEIWFEVRVATSYTEALAVLDREDDLALVVSDLKLGPGPGGDQLLQEVKTRLPSAKRVLVSGACRNETEPALRSGAAELFLEKPWRPGQLGRACLALTGFLALTLPG